MKIMDYKSLFRGFTVLMVLIIGVMEKILAFFGKPNRCVQQHPFADKMCFLTLQTNEVIIKFRLLMVLQSTCKMGHIKLK